MLSLSLAFAACERRPLRVVTKALRGAEAAPCATNTAESIGCAKGTTELNARKMCFGENRSVRLKLDVAEPARGGRSRCMAFSKTGIEQHGIHAHL